MDWLVYILFLLVGYWLRMMNEPKKKEEKPSFSMPTLNPVKAVKEHIQTAKEKEEEERIERETQIMLANIERYDGTSNGQREVR